MKTNNDNIIAKLEITVQKTEAALGRIQRFVTKYGPDLNNNQIKRISKSLQELQKEVSSVKTI